MMYHMFGKYQGDKKFVENVGRCADIVVRATHIMASRYDDNLKKKHNIIQRNNHVYKIGLWNCPGGFTKGKRGNYFIFTNHNLSLIK